MLGRKYERKTGKEKEIWIATEALFLAIFPFEKNVKASIV